ncbi:MAG: hypothetical protein CMJ18_08900 [Phycisphaeraceae bacterium]|nr:hypothetical protein [Phycisphaeraceae bacterium]
MTERADAHIHLFDNAYQGSFCGRPGVAIDEAKLFESLAGEHGVTAALVVAFADLPWCAQNNTYLAGLTHVPWIQATAYHNPDCAPSPAELDALRGKGFVGLSMYITDEQRVEQLQQVSDDTWSWLVDHRWLISVNSRLKLWDGFVPVLERHPQLRVVGSHLGLPPKVTSPIDAAQARRDLGILAIAPYPGPRVKLSGFYAMTDPGHDYPHETAWPYVEQLRDGFGSKRLLWASDYSPCLDYLTYAQTMDLFEKMPFLDAAQREQILGANLHQLIRDVTS